MVEVKHSVTVNIVMVGMVFRVRVWLYTVDGNGWKSFIRNISEYSSISNIHDPKT